MWLPNTATIIGLTHFTCHAHSSGYTACIGIHNTDPHSLDTSTQTATYLTQSAAHTNSCLMYREGDHFTTTNIKIYTALLDLKQTAKSATFYYYKTRLNTLKCSSLDLVGLRWVCPQWIGRRGSPALRCHHHCLM